MVDALESWLARTPGPVTDAFLPEPGLNFPFPWLAVVGNVCKSQMLPLYLLTEVPSMASPQPPLKRQGPPALSLLLLLELLYNPTGFSAPFSGTDFHLLGGPGSPLLPVSLLKRRGHSSSELLSAS